jgi:DNA polymerase III delta prime subunit
MAGRDSHVTLGANRTSDEFYNKCFGLHYRDDFHKYRDCLQVMNVFDHGDTSRILALPPPLVVGAGVSALQIRDALKIGVHHQDQALDTIAAAVSTRLNQLDHEKPCVLLLPGPTATGKTSTTEELVKYLFGEQVWNNPVKQNTIFLRVDINTYVDEHSIGRLIGADPGLVTSDTGKGMLIEWLENLEDKLVPDRPVSGVLLLDEIEKAGPNSRIMVRLMSLMDHGAIDGVNTFKRLTAKKLIILCATNAGAELLLERPSSSHLSQETATALRKVLVKECCGNEDSSYGRFDKMVPYFGFTQDQARDIINSTAKKRLERICARYSQRINVRHESQLLMDRMVAMWNADGTNARAVRNFCSNFDALVLHFTQNFPQLLENATKAKPLNLIIRGTDLGIECVGEERQLVTQVLPRLDTSLLSGWHRLAVKLNGHPSASDLRFLDIADIDKPDDDGRSPLHYAASCGNLAMVQYLLDQGVNATLRDDRNYNALMHAISPEVLDVSVNGLAPRVFDGNSAEKCVNVIRELCNHNASTLDELLSTPEECLKQRSALLIAFDELLIAFDELLITKAKDPPERYVFYLHAVDELICFRMQSTAHIECLLSWDRLGYVMNYPCDRDEEGRTLLDRLMAFHHKEHESVPDIADQAVKTPLLFLDKFPAFSKCKPEDFWFLAQCVPSVIESLECAKCIDPLLHFMQTSICVHRNRLCRRAAVGAVNRWADNPTDRINSQVLQVFEQRQVPIQWDAAELTIKSMEAVLNFMDRFHHWSDISSPLPACECGCVPKEEEWRAEDPNILEWFTHQRFVNAVEQDVANDVESVIEVPCTSPAACAVLRLLSRLLNSWRSVELLFFPAARSSKNTPWPQIQQSLLYVYCRRCTTTAANIECSKLIRAVFGQAFKIMPDPHKAYWVKMCPVDFKFDPYMESLRHRDRLNNTEPSALVPSTGLTFVSPPPSSASSSSSLSRAAPVSSTIISSSAGMVGQKTLALVHEVTAAIDAVGINNMNIDDLRTVLNQNPATKCGKSTFNAALSASKVFQRNTPRGSLLVPRQAASDYPNHKSNRDPVADSTGESSSTLTQPIDAAGTLSSSAPPSSLSSTTPTVVPHTQNSQGQSKKRKISNEPPPSSLAPTPQQALMDNRMDIDSE